MGGEKVPSELPGERCYWLGLLGECRKSNGCASEGAANATSSGLDCNSSLRSAHGML